MKYKIVIRNRRLMNVKINKQLLIFQLKQLFHWYFMKGFVYCVSIKYPYNWIKYFYVLIPISPEKKKLWKSGPVNFYIVLMNKNQTRKRYFSCGEFLWLFTSIPHMRGCEKGLCMGMIVTDNCLLNFRYQNNVYFTWISMYGCM